MKPYDIYAKPPRTLRRIAVTRNGAWVFTSIPANSFVRQTPTQKFYLMNENFNLCVSGQTDPSRAEFKGKPGDYISADPQNNLTLVTKTDYERKYSAKFKTGSNPPLNSEDFMRESRRQLTSNNSNSSTTINSSTSTGGTTNAGSTTTRTSY